MATHAPNTLQALSADGGAAARWLGRGMVLLAALLVAWLLVLVVREWSRPPARPHRQVSRVVLLPDSPPPMPLPLPPKAAQPDKPTPRDLPTQAAAPAPVAAPHVDAPAAPADAPALRAEGEAGNAPGLLEAGTVSQAYDGQSLGQGSASGVGGGRLQWSLFGSQLQRQLQAQLGREAALRSQRYQCSLRVWIRGDGTLERSSIVPRATQDESAAPCQALTDSLHKLGYVGTPPPPGMPQPLLLRVANRP